MAATYPNPQPIHFLLIQLNHGNVESKWVYPGTVVEVRNGEAVINVSISDEYSEDRVFGSWPSSLLTEGLLPGDQCEITLIQVENQLTISIKNLLFEDYRGC